MPTRLTTRPARLFACAAWALAAFGLTAPLTGCNFMGWAAHSLQKDLPKDVKARYTDLDNQKIAVIVQASSLLYAQSPQGPDKVAYGMGIKIQENVPGSTVLPKATVDQYLVKNIGWMAKEPSELLAELKVDRIVLMDLYEYRTHEPGNPHVKMGLMAANLRIYSTDLLDPNDTAFQTDVRMQWPNDTKIGTVETSAEQVEQVTLSRFLRDAAGLFYDHTIPPGEY